MSNFNLFKFIFVATVLCLIFAAIGTIDLEISIQELKSDLNSEFTWKNWHYAFLVLLITLKG